MPEPGVHQPAPSPATDWFSALLAILVIAFLMTLAFLSVFGLPVPCHSRFLVIAVVAFAAALCAAVIGGRASARGHVSIPGIGDKPIVVSFSGGVLVLFVMLVLQHALYSEGNCTLKSIDGDTAFKIAIASSLDPEVRLANFKKVCADCELSEADEALLRSAPQIEQTPTQQAALDALTEATTLQEALEAADAYDVAACNGDFRFVVNNGLVSCANGLSIPFLQSPNQGQQEITPQLVVLHSTVSSRAAPTVGVFMNPERQVSTHLLISRSGAVTQLVPLNRPAFHAGNGTWDGMTSLNNHSVGIDFVNLEQLKETPEGLTDVWGRQVSAENAVFVPEKDALYERFTPEQLAVGTALINAVYDSLGGPIPTVRHSDISPGRRTDPGPAFPYQEFCLQVVCPEDLQTPDQIEGYVYYETDSEGRPTEDGRLVPTSGGNLLVRDIYKGMVLEALSTVRVREEATSNSRQVRVLAAGDCIIVTGPKTNPWGDLGAWLPFKSVTCDD